MMKSGLKEGFLLLEHGDGFETWYLKVPLVMAYGRDCE